MDVKTPTHKNSLDDFPEVAPPAARQEFIGRYYRALTILPFMAALFIGIRFFGENSKTTLFLVGAAGIWIFGILGYHVYLIFSLRCPVCGWRFGRGSKCSSCGLPRHAPTPDLVTELNRE